MGTRSGGASEQRGPYGNTFPMNGAGLLFDDLWRGWEDVEVGPGKGTTE